MTMPSIPRNAYTRTPAQHPNLILGSLQLLFWLVFRPSAWVNLIQRLAQTSDKDFSLLRFLQPQLRRQKITWQFLFQGYFFLPVLSSLFTGLILLGLGAPIYMVVYGMAVGVVHGVVFSMAFSVVYGVAVGLAIGVAGSVGGGVAYGMAGGLVGGVAFCAAVGMAFGVTYGVVYNAAFSLVGGVVVSVAAGWAFGVAGGLAYGAAFGVAAGLVFGWAAGWATGGVARGWAGGVVVSIVVSVAFGLVFGLACGLVFGLAGGWAAGGWVGGVAIGVAISAGLWVNWWRPVLISALLLPWHNLLYRMDRFRVGKLPSLLHKHLAFWDEWQYLPIKGLDKHLLLVLEHSPVEGRAALDYLSSSRQRWAAQAAQIELDARQLECCADIATMAQAHYRLTAGELTGPADTLFRSFQRISEDVEAAVNQASAYNQRLALNVIGERLDGLLRELTRSSDKFAVRFRPIAQGWSEVIAQHIKDLTQATELRQEIDSPYIIGVPLTEQQAIFVGRNDISARLEQLLLDRRHPPLLLYGQRRIGKTSLLNNLGRMLPRRIIPMFVDLQGPASSASDHAGFLYNLTRGMTTSAKRQHGLMLPPLQRETLTADPFTTFDEWLDQVEAALEGNTALLALDEFEALDQVLTEGRFSEAAILGMLRNLIQHRPQFKVLLAGSHTLEEFQRWSSYLINAQVLHLGYLKESEARQLVEHPIEGFALRYAPDASQRVLDVTSGHPFLVQLLCAEIVAFKNEQDPTVRRLATLADVEAAIPEALSSGSMFFSDIEKNQIDANTLAVLRWLARQGEGVAVSASHLSEQFPDDWQRATELLLRRELIEQTSNGYCFRVELIRRWFIR